MNAKSYLVVGAQFGDEGKGKVVDVIVERGGVETVVRYNGGANAGHTIVLDDGKFPLHQIPSGILHPEVLNLIGAGVVLDPPALLKEIEVLRDRRVACDNLRIADRAHLVMPWHRVLDAHLGKSIGTTARGIGPCYEDRASRRGLRVGDLVDFHGRVDRDHFARRVREVGADKNALLQKVHGLEPLDLDAVIQEYCDAAATFAHQVTDISALLEERAGQVTLFEGAQGALLDVDWGTYPFVTSSSVSLGGCIVGVGLDPNPELRLGIVKAYATRVGEGPFPTELGDYEVVKQKDSVEPGSTPPDVSPEDQRAALQGDDYLMGRWLRLVGAEFGTTTGRPRRTGWLDMVTVRHAIRVSGLNALALTKLDILDGIPTLKVATAYDIRGARTTRMPARARDLAVATPVYEELEGWESLGSAESFEDLPEAARRYVTRLEELAGVPVRLVSVGSHRAQSLLR